MQEATTTIAPDDVRRVLAMCDVEAFMLERCLEPGSDDYAAVLTCVALLKPPEYVAALDRWARGEATAEDRCVLDMED